MLKIFIVFFVLMCNFIVAGDEVSFYTGTIRTLSDKGNFLGTKVILNSEDETSSNYLWYKKIKMESGLDQTNIAIMLKKEKDISNYMFLYYEDLSNNVIDGNIYGIGYSINDTIDQEISFLFSLYSNKARVHQFKYSVKSMIEDYPIFIKFSPCLVLIDKNEKKYKYLSSEAKIGFIQGKNLLSFSFNGFKSRYLVDYNKFYNCPFGVLIYNYYNITYTRSILLNFETSLMVSQYKTDNGNIKFNTLYLNWRF